MMGAIFSAFSQLTIPSVVILLIVGTVAGLGIGLLPGIGSIVAISLLLPFTFHMTSFQAFALLLSLYAVVTTAGDLTSILVGIPAHPECAAMILDGYPMARRGEAGRAMAASTYSATIGAVIGAIALALSVPVMQQIVLHIGAPELFMLAVLGVIMVGVVSGDYPLQGVVMGGIGLMLAAVGPDVQTGIIRYGFGNPYLIGGVPLVPLAVGLFAVPQLFQMHGRRRQSLGKSASLSTSGRGAGLRDTLRHWTLVIRGSLIGVITGMAPGLGSALGQWVAYGAAMQSSKTPERFGKGAIEGVIAPGASNNSKEGGALIPTLAFGVPGSGAMAVLLGAFLILGLTPGPDMLTKHLNVTFFMVIVLVISNILGSVLCLLLLRPLAGVTRLRGSILVPIVMFLVFVGAAAATGQVGDLVVMLVAGVMAWILGVYEWPVIPVILGYVLGKSAEPNLFIAQRSYGWAFLERPIVIGLAAVTLVTLVWSIRLRRRQRALKGAATAEAGSTSPVGGAASWMSLVLAVVITAALAFAVVRAQPWPRNAKLYPTIVGVVTCALGAACVFQWVVSRVRARQAARKHQGSSAGTNVIVKGGPDGSWSGVSGMETPTSPGGGSVTNPAQAETVAGAREEVRVAIQPSPDVSAATVASSMRQELATLGWLGVMFAGSWLFGIGVAAVVFALVYLLFSCREKLRIAVPIAVGVGLMYYVVFVKLLSITLPVPMFHII